MARQQLQCDIDGEVFTGQYESVGHGESAAVSVQFGGNSISAMAGHLGAEVVARTLLGELIREKLALDQGWPVSRQGMQSPGQAQGVHYRYGPSTARG